MSRGGRGWGRSRGGRGNRGRGSGRRGSWHRDGQGAGTNAVDADGGVVPELSWNKRRYNNRRGGRRFNGRNYTARVIIDHAALKEARKCIECRCDDAVYRCPACLKKFCSLDCWKTHKAGTNCVPKIMNPECGTEGNENSMEIENPDSEKLPPTLANRRKPIITRKYFFPTKDTVRREGLEKLNKEPLRDTMVEMFQSESLRAKIRTLDSSEQPKPLLDQLMKDQEFSKFSSVVVDALSDELVKKLAVRRK